MSHASHWRDQANITQDRLAEARGLARDLTATLEKRNRELAALKENLRGIEWAASGYCPACGGWNADPRDPKRGCTPHIHTSNCWLGAAISGHGVGNSPEPKS